MGNKKSIFIKYWQKWNSMPVTLKASTAYTICSVLQRCMSFITLPLFTRLLTTTQYGQSTVFASWSSLLAIVLTLNLAYGSFSTAMVKFEDDRDGYISSLQGICIALSTFFLLIYLPLRSTFNILFGLPTIIIVIMVFQILFNNAVLFWMGRKRFEYRYKEVVILTLLMTVISPAIEFLAVISFEEKGYARIIASSLVTIVFGIVIFCVNLGKNRRLFNKNYWKYALGFNVPLISYYMSQMIFNQSDRIMISHYCGESKAAVYGVAYTLALILTFVLNAINNSYVPWFYEHIKEENVESNQKLSIYIASLMAVLILLVIIAAPEVILVMAGQKYIEAIWVVPPVAISLLLLFYAQLFINVEFYFEQKSSLVWASILGALINVVLNALLIPKMGYVVAGYTTFISYIVFVIMNYLVFRKISNKYEFLKESFDIKKLLLLLIVFICLSFGAMFLYNYPIIRYSILAVVLIVSVIFRDAIIKFFNHKIIKKEI